jgi:hypothetical protein
MGHRALVAYEYDTDPNVYDVHYSHWGAHGLELKNSITSEEPYAGGKVDEEPQSNKHEFVDMETVVNELMDYLMIEALYVVDSDYNVQAYKSVGYDHGVGIHEPVGDYLDTENKDRSAHGCLIPARWVNREAVSSRQDHGFVIGVAESAAELASSGYFDGYEEGITWVHQRIKARFSEYTNRDDYEGYFMSTEEEVPFQYQGDKHRVI